jgi:Sporulation and spore germination
MPRRGSLWPWLAVLAASGAVIGAIAWDVWPRTVDLSLLRSRASGAASAPAPAAEHVRVRLFFPHEAKSVLAEEERDVPRQTPLPDAVRAVMKELTKGGGPGTVPPLPSETDIRQVSLDAFGILYLDFVAGIEALATGDAIRAGLNVSAVVLTLTTNFGAVKRVQFLAAGKELSAQIGSADLRRPLQPHFPGEESQPITSQPQETQ